MKSKSNLQRTIPRPRVPGYCLWFCLVLTCVPGIAHAQSTKPVVILLGPPASGKSTQAALIQQQYGFALITREQLMQDDPSMLARSKGTGAKAIEPRVDPALNNLFIKRLEKTEVRKGLLLDGYPSTKDHGDFLMNALQPRGFKKPLILKLELSDEAVRERLKGQDAARLEQDRKDYHRETDYISTYFPQADIIKIDGSQREKPVFEQIRKAIEAYMKKP